MPNLISLDELDAQMAAVCAQLEDGQCVALPTETVYGLAADATNGLAVARIFEMKQRPKFNPLICHVSDITMAARIGKFGKTAQKLAEAFWPGPLTLVLPLLEKPEIHPLVTAMLGTAALRCPQGPATKIIRSLGKPLAAPSANRSGRLSPTTVHHVASEFAGTDLTILDGGSCEIGIESTIVKPQGGSIKILRPGSITPAMIEAVTGFAPELVSQGAIEAPGMMQSHYAPNAVVQPDRRICPEGAALLAFGDGRDCDRKLAFETMNLSPDGDLKEAAANLYHALKSLDETGAGVISVEPIPATGLGLAINDRLKRAAAPRPGTCK